MIVAEYTTVEAAGQWLQLSGDLADPVLASCVVAANSVVTRYAGEDASDQTIPTLEDAEQAATMLAARLYRRRNSPEGVQGITPEGVAVGIVRSDADIARLLRIDGFAVPQVG